MRVRNYLVTHKKCDPQTDAVQNENITHPLHYITVNYFTANSILTKSEQMQFCSSCKSVLIPVLLYGWQDDNIIEEEDADDGNDVAGEAPYRESVVPAGNFHLRGDEEDQPDHDGPGECLINK